MLSIKNITYKAGKKKLLDDVSAEIEAGRLNLIIGPNGAGKSTLVKIICNELRPLSGAVYYGDKALTTISIPELAKMRAVLSQNVELSFPLTVAEIVMMGRYPHFSGQPSAKDEQACEEAMRFFDVLDMADRNYLSLSGGEKQRVHFARVLSQIWLPLKNSCRYLILDEPLTFLDVRYQFDFMHKLTELLKQNDLVMLGVVHDLNLAAKFADKLLLLHSGKLLACGNKQTVLTKENIKNAYGIEPVIHYQNEAMYISF